MKDVTGLMRGGSPSSGKGRVAQSLCPLFLPKKYLVQAEGCLYSSEDHGLHSQLLSSFVTLSSLMSLCFLTHSEEGDYRGTDLIRLL